MTIRKEQLNALLIAGLITTSAMAQTTSTTTRTINFPLIGLGSSQTVQVSVANSATTSSSGTAASCTGTIAFFTAAGTAIGAATPFTVASGVVFAATLPFSKAGGTGSHAVVRAVVTDTPASGVPCQLNTLVEVYDTASGVDARTLEGSTIGSGPGGR